MLSTLIHLFTPHYTNNHRPRILHPAGLAVLTGVFVFFTMAIRLLGYAPLPRGVVLGFASSISVNQVIEQTNTERAKAGLPPLAANPLLSQAAINKANHMFQYDYWAHIAPDGTTPWYFIKATGYTYTIAGENLARDFDDTASMMAAWMASTSHRDNIVNAKFTEIGVAVVNGTLEGIETTLVVQMFGAPSTTLAASVPEGTGSTSNPPAPTAVLTAATPRPANPTPTRAPTLAPTINPIAAVEPTLPPSTPAPVYGQENTYLTAPVAGAATKLLISPLTLTKSVAVSIMMLLVSVLMYDSYVVHKHKIFRRSGKNWAHLSLFGLIIMLVALMGQGAIL